MAQGAKLRVKGLDGVRGLAAVAVVLHHTWIGSRNLGEVPVDVFFVLSGFLICGILHAARQRIDARRSTTRTELFHFWVNRGLRILPLYYCVLILTGLAALALDTYKDLTQHFVWYVFYLQNFLIAFVITDFGSLGHTWTLAVEQQFYIVFGVLMLLVPAKRHMVLLVLALAISFAGAVWAIADFSFPGGFVLPFRSFVPVICGGIASIAIGKIGQPGSRSKLSAVALTSCAALSGLSLLPMNATLEPVVGFLILIGAAVFSSILFIEITRNQSGIVTKVLDVPVLRWLGDLSYGIYIIHGIVRGVGLDRFQMYKSPVTFTIVLAVTLVLAQASRTFIELPALKMKYRMKRTERPAAQVVV